MQKSQRVEDRMWRLPKRLQQRRQRGFGGACALGVTTHAVDDDQQYGLLRSRDRNPVLIFFPMTNQADVGGLNLQ